MEKTLYAAHIWTEQTDQFLLGVFQVESEAADAVDDWMARFPKADALGTVQKCTLNKVTNYGP